MTSTYLGYSGLNSVIAMKLGAQDFEAIFQQRVLQLVELAEQSIL